MMKKLSDDDFEDFLCEMNEDDIFQHIKVSLILDTTGLLAMRAIEWLEKQTEGGRK